MTTVLVQSNLQTLPTKVTMQQMNSESSMHFLIYVFPAQ